MRGPERLNCSKSGVQIGSPIAKGVLGFFVFFFTFLHVLEKRLDMANLYIQTDNFLFFGFVARHSILCDIYGGYNAESA